MTSGKIAISEPQALPLVYLDSNIFIQAFETGEPASDLARLFAVLAESPGRSATSEYTFGEVLGRRGTFATWDLQKAFYKDLLFDRRFVRLAPVDRDLFEKTGDLRLAARDGARSLRLADAIHTAAALTLGCEYLLTGDLRLGAALPPPLRYVAPTSDGVALLLAALDA